MDPSKDEDEEDGAFMDADQQSNQGKSAVIKTSTRQVNLNSLN